MVTYQIPINPILCIFNFLFKTTPMKRTLIFVITATLLGGFGNIKAQNRSNNIWCFGYYNELNFNSGFPLNTGPTQMGTMGGATSIADSATGQLLFYTDGYNVWDTTNTKMPGNTIPLSANYSQSTTPALIVPKPGNNNQYYIITSGSTINYSIIDMTLHSGLGDVAQQPSVLLSDTAYALAGTRMTNGSGYWMLTHTRKTNAFYAYPITASGIGAPIISNQGPVDSIEYYMKFSPDGNRIAANINSGPAKLFIMNFNNSTGAVSAPYFIDSIFPGSAEGGISFSPNSNLLYIGIVFDSIIYQYDISSGNAATILASKYALGTTYSAGFGSSPTTLQIGPDLKIYVGIYDSYVLDAINFPNVPGSGCQYQKASVSLPNLCMWGLPNFMDYVFLSGQSFPLTGNLASTSAGCGNACQGTAIATAFNGHPPYSYLWNPGNFATDSIGNLCSGTYYVTITDSLNATFVDSVVISSLALPVVTLSADSPLCTFGPGEICATNGYDVYAWNNGATSSCFIPDSSGTYWVTVTNADNCSASSNQLSVTVHTSPVVSSGFKGDTLFVNTNAAVTYQWYTTSGTAVAGENSDTCYCSSQNFYVIVTDTNGCAMTKFFGATGISEITADKIVAFPNPQVNGSWEIKVNDALVGNAFEVFDITGKKIYNSVIRSNQFVLSFTGIPGEYLLKVNSPNQTTVVKLIQL
jgi:hypothetical protein